ncbi:MAG: SelB C-terminal domain-containing protein [Candidatus Aminicenantes bacterium]|nr:SelB C-terminal domain-containing protein [Candidatus Aminicenantes bacterium]
MKFNSYFIQLTHRESAFTGNLIIGDNPVHTNFKKIGNNIFIAYFKNQVELKFLENIEFKNKSKSVVVLFPVISKYNKRKLTKIAKILSSAGMIEKNTLLLDFLTVEKILRVGELLYFFSESKNLAVNLLTRMELDKKIKIIDFHNLSITSYKNFLEYRKELKTVFNNYVINRDNAVKLSEIEPWLKLPISSIFFKYLLHSLDENFSFRIVKDKIIFRALTLSEKEKEYIKKIEDALKKNKAPIFAIDDILKSTDLHYKEVNDSMWYLLDVGKVVQLNKKCFIFSNDLHKIINKLKKYKRNQGEMIGINSFRELTSYSRKYIIILFEYFDSRHITTRVENERKILLVV